MTPLSRAFALLSIAVLSAADPDGLTNCGETSTVPGLVGENTTISFPFTGTCKTVIANYADGSEESISVTSSDCGSSASPDASQVYQIAFGSSSPRGLASILFNCNGGLQVFCQRYNITTGDAPSAQDTTNITAMCNETTTYSPLPSDGSLDGVIASTPTNTRQFASTLLTVTPTPSQGTHGTIVPNSAGPSSTASEPNQEQSARNNSGAPSRTDTASPTSQNSATPPVSDGGGSGTYNGGGANTSPSSTTPSVTAAAGQSIYSLINTPYSPYVPLTPQSSCICTC